MSAALKSDVQVSPPGRRQLTQNNPASTHSNLRLVSPRQTDGKSVSGAVKSFPAKGVLPLWLHCLVGIEKGVSFLTLGLVTSTLVLYGWTVYSQRMWSQQYQHLNAVQKTQQQLLMANEVLKNHLARQAESSNSGLELPALDRGVYLQSSSQSGPASVLSKPIAESPAAASWTAPIGY